MTKKVQRPADQPPVNPPEWPHPGIAGPIGELQRQVSLRGANTPDEFMTALSDVVRRNDDFLDLFGGSAWGHIAWERDVGLPLSAKLADAFVITHKFQEIKVSRIQTAPGRTSAGGRMRPRRSCGTGPPHDEAHYRVSFMLHGQPPWTNGVGIDLNRDVPWEPRVAPWLAERVRYVTYPSSLQQTGSVWPTKDGVTDFDDFQVLWSPF